MLLLLALAAGGRSQPPTPVLPPPLPPRCSTEWDPELPRDTLQGEVHSLTVAGKPRCFALLRPPTARPVPVLLYHHGGGGNAERCGIKPNVARNDTLRGAVARHGALALICTEALQLPTFPPPNPCTGATGKSRTG